MPERIRLEIVIAGGGFAGIYAAQALRRALGKPCWQRVALIADENFMLFQPLLAEVASSALTPRHVVSPLRRVCRGVRVLRGAVREIDLKERRLTLDAGAFSRNVSVEFDHLVLGLGSIVDLRKVPGMAEHAFLMKNVGDALTLRATVIDRFEEAALVTTEEVRRRLLTFVVVGGGYSGVETAGQLYDLLRRMRRFYPSLASIEPRVVLIHSGERLLPTMSEKLALYTQETLVRRGLEILLKARVTAVTAGKVRLDNGRELETHTVVSTIGNAPHPVVTDLCERFDLPRQAGRILTGPDLRVAGVEGLWAAGDCAAVPHEAGGLCPTTAQFAMRQGKLVGQNVAATVAGGEIRTFGFSGLGELAAIGHRTAVAEILGFKFSGFFAWWLWRTIYLGKLPGFERKVRVVLDWTLDLIFPRDISVFRPTPSEPLKEMHLEAGDAVFHAGEPAFSFYVVKAGRVDLLDDKGLVKSLGPGEHFGERALLEDKIWRFDAIARERSTLVAVEAETFEAFTGASTLFRTAVEQTAGQYLPRGQLHELIERLAGSLDHARAEDLMTSQVVALRQDQSLAEALDVVRRHGYNSYPVVDEAGRPVGIFTQEDLYEAYRTGVESLSAFLRARPPLPLPTIRQETALPSLVETFYRSGNRKLLVVDAEGKLRGILALIDLLAVPPDRADAERGRAVAGPLDRGKGG